MADMLATETPMVVYTDQPALIRRMRGALPTKIVHLSLDALNWQKGYDAAFWRHQRQLDPERDGPHRNVDKDLFRIWDSKMEFVQRAMDSNPFSSERFWWMDIGSVRDGKRWGEWPDTSKVDRLCRERVCVTDSQHMTGTVYPCGCTFGGAVQPLRQYIALFYKQLHAWASSDRWIGMDQDSMKQVVAEHPELFHVIKADRGDPWFAMWPTFGHSGPSASSAASSPFPMNFDSGFMQLLNVR